MLGEWNSLKGAKELVRLAIVMVACAIVFGGSLWWFLDEAGLAKVVIFCPLLIASTRRHLRWPGWLAERSSPIHRCRKLSLGASQSTQILTSWFCGTR